MGTINWDLVITPNGFKEKGNARRNWVFLILLFVKRDIVTRYKQNVLGPIWFIISPLITSTIYYFVFFKIANIPTESENPFLFYVSGVIPWQFFSSSLSSVSGTFTNNSHIFGKVYFPRIITPVATVLTQMVQFFIQLLVFLAIAILVFQFSFGFDDLMLRLGLGLASLFILVVCAMGFGLLFSSVIAKYRDMGQVIGFILQLWMYGTPIIYPSSIVPSNLVWVVELNPLVSVFNSLRFTFFGGEYSGSLLYGFCFSVVIMVLGYTLFKRTEKNFIDSI